MLTNTKIPFIILALLLILLVFLGSTNRNKVSIIENTKKEQKEFNETDELAFIEEAFPANKFSHEFRATLFRDTWDKSKYKRDPEEISRLAKLFVDYMNNYHKEVYINDVPILYPGGNAGGYSPVTTRIAYNSNIYSAYHYQEFKEFNTFLDSCADDYVSRYIENLPKDYTEIYIPTYIDGVARYSQEKYRITLEDIQRDLSCVGNIKFKDTYFGIE